MALRELILIKLWCIYMVLGVIIPPPNFPEQPASAADEDIFSYSSNVLSHYDDIENLTTWSVICYDRSTRRKYSCTLRVTEFSSRKGDKNSISTECEIPSSADIVSDYAGKIDLQVFRFGVDLYLIHWIDSNLMKMYHENENDVLDDVANEYPMKLVIMNIRGCQSVPVYLGKVPNNLRIKEVFYYTDNYNILLNEDTFDIIYSFSEESDLFQETFNDKGEKIFGPVGESSHRINPQAVMTLKGKKKNSFSVNSRERYSVREICLKNVPTKFPCRKIHYDGRYYAQSTSLNTWTNCRKQSYSVKSWDCQQLSSSSYAKFNITFDYPPGSIMIYNVLPGKLLTMSTKEDILLHGHKYVVYLTMFDIVNPRPKQNRLNKALYS
ncbi:hypothetical protein QAD02_023192 [Eretmocerus hayati]|uniref:Uncharacterized protein n=1 Tax=Eretmocerus hayati TaxID=131215 RepID=A0ACC2PV83_9HYME|nr:hypothetical protein QAD02_023192 [Eretmocerus hayati]